MAGSPDVRCLVPRQSPLSQASLAGRFSRRQVECRQVILRLRAPGAEDGSGLAPPCGGAGEETTALAGTGRAVEGHVCPGTVAGMHNRMEPGPISDGAADRQLGAGASLGVVDGAFCCPVNRRCCWAYVLCGWNLARTGCSPSPCCTLRMRDWPWRPGPCFCCRRWLCCRCGSGSSRAATRPGSCARAACSRRPWAGS